MASLAPRVSCTYVDQLLSSNTPSSSQKSPLSTRHLTTARHLVQVAGKYSHQAVETEHLLAAMLEQSNGLARRILQKAEADPSAMLEQVDGHLRGLPKVSGHNDQVCPLVPASALKAHLGLHRAALHLYATGALHLPSVPPKPASICATWHDAWQEICQAMRVCCIHHLMLSSEVHDSRYMKEVVVGPWQEPRGSDHGCGGTQGDVEGRLCVHRAPRAGRRGRPVLWLPCHAPVWGDEGFAGASDQGHPWLQAGLWCAPAALGRSVPPADVPSRFFVHKWCIRASCEQNAVCGAICEYTKHVLQQQSQPRTSSGRDRHVPHNSVLCTTVCVRPTNAVHKHAAHHADACPAATVAVRMHAGPPWLGHACSFHVP